MPPSPAPSTLNCDLAQATYDLLARLGVVSPGADTLPATAFSRTHHVTVGSLPLISQADAVVLLSALPSSLLPSPCPYPISASPATPAARRLLLDTVARLSLEPSLTMEVMRCFRVLAPHLWGRWLEMLGFEGGAWRGNDTEEVEGERAAVEKVYTACVRLLGVFDNIMPFLTTLLRHPLLVAPILPPSPESSPAALVAAPLLTLDSLLNSHPVPSHWSFPPSIEQTLKSHPSRAIRLLAWRILRNWYGLYSSLGEELKDEWVWKGDAGEAAPLPAYLAEYAEEYEREFGPSGVRVDDDTLPWETRLAGSVQCVKGGISVGVVHRAVDVWVLGAALQRREVEERRSMETREGLTVWSGETDGGIGQLCEDELAGAVVSIEGILLFKEGLIPSTTATGSTPPSPPTTPIEPFVNTASTSLLLKSLAHHVQLRLPVLISSPSSAGKSSTIAHLWTTLHSSSQSARLRNLVTINLADRSLDSKSLLGSLSSAPSTASSTAGTFTFIEGPLTRAVRQGRWVVLASIDQASTEVLSVVKVLVERMRSAAIGRVGKGEEGGSVGVRVGGGTGRWVEAGPGFMLFATRSIERQSEPSFFASAFWSEVWLERQGREEIAMIVKGRYERLGELGDRLIGVWEEVRKVREGGKIGMGRVVGVRDLLRWCRRVQGLLPRDLSIESILSNPILQEEIFTEARDVFLGSLPLPPSTPSLDPLAISHDRYTVVATVLALGLGLSSERAEWVLRKRVPGFDAPKPDETDGRASKVDLVLKIGRVALPYRPQLRLAAPTRPYALTKPSLIVLEKLAVCLKLSEPVLMVGETGTGKTAAVGYLAELLGKRLTALNLSNQTEAGDLIGGFRPIDEAEEAKRMASEVVNRFVDLFGQTFSISRNAEYVTHVRKAFEKKRYQRLVGLWREAYRMATDRINGPTVEAAATTAMDTTETTAPRKRRKVASASDLPTAWNDFLTTVGDFDLRHVQKGGKSKFVFSFVEGPLAKAIRNGDWVLLDEVNLASAETLESLSTLLQTPDSSLILAEQGDLEPIPRHPEFRLFACMNPATDVGKRDLPAGLRAKFSEIWVPSPDEDRDALVKIIEGYIGGCTVHDRPAIHHVADLYTSIKALATGAQLADGSNQPPHFSIRTLARALTFTSEFTPVFGLRRSLYEGFVMAFTMLLDPKSSVLVKALLDVHIVAPAKNRGSLFSQIPTKPASIESIRFGPYWLETGPEALEEPADYILTPSVQLKVLDLARAVLTRKVPVLIQGPTSSGKTSVVEYLARRTGHRFVRINNHEHTDIQEYIGTYVSDPDSGKLVFQEGVLVRALRRGDWIVLDELNLAPTDVLEALNRLLDDNRELVIPETGEVVRPHPHFMLFATQNPPGLYGGRKVLSRAFRNRFLEMHFGDVPKEELEEILCRRCQIAPSYAKKTVAVFLELQRRRQAGRVFEAKNAFATLRDLFRWGGRGSVGYQQLAEDGYMLLAERARKADDKAVVKAVIEEEMKVVIDDSTLYDFSRLTAAGLIEPPTTTELVWTNAMRRLYYLIAAGLHRNEPILLVGETGSGKTSVCQSLALALGLQLHVVGCHQNTETADLLGGQRPLRNRAALQSTLRTEALTHLAPDATSPSDDFDDVMVLIEALEKATEDGSQAALRDLAQRMRRTTALFEWHDGPLVQAMHAGDLILLDEISLADDSVLERLNSVLEPSRTLVLAEKGGRDLDDIRVVAHPTFQILATMNPGGDFGKKELSPALRNRFTEIWVPLVDDPVDLLQIIGSRWQHLSLESFGPKILDFGKWFGEEVGVVGGLGIGLRDILAWVDFLNASVLRTSASAPLLTIADAFCQGALMTVVDGLGALPTTAGLTRDGLDRLRTACYRRLETLVPLATAPESTSLDVVDADNTFYVGSFGVSKGPLLSATVDYTLQAPTTRLNAMRLLRALQLTKPVLLEGSPGVGKTSLVTAIAAATGHNLIRINLSDQTDLMDLLGSDLPVEGGRSGEFAWKDAPFLAAMQEGAWVLLDEMNLASQSILEGLNSCLDHRGTVYIPELDRTFTRHPEFRIFAAQNPLGQGGGRKGLPKSFLDRFSIVHMEELNSTDLNAIASALFPDVDAEVLRKMIAFNSSIHLQTMQSHSFGMEGAPWEFNLRDVLRWLALLRSSSGLDLRAGEPVEYVGLLYVQRFRNLADRNHVARLFAEAFSESLAPSDRPWPSIGPHSAQIGHSLVHRADRSFNARQINFSPLLQRSLQPMEALVKCLEMGWLAILTGTRSSGKTTLVRQLASYEGRTLREFSMNAEVDTLELLGSFEQAERFREVDRIALEVLQIVHEALREQLHSTTTVDLHSHITTLEHLREVLGDSASEFDPIGASTIIHAALTLVSATSAGAASQAASIWSRLEAAATAAPPTARFEWIDGPLVQAMKNGDWLLIEDANLCSPSVLDRLNSLFEPGGRLQLAERGPVNGEIQIIFPHPNFRLVMTLDPRHGELSRAMRNRGIEIALIPAEPTEEDQRRLAAFSRTSSSTSAGILSYASLVDGSSTAPAAELPPLGFAPDELREPTLAPVLATASLQLLSPDLDPVAFARHLLGIVATSHYGIMVRFLRTMELLDGGAVESSIHRLGRHSLVRQIGEAKEAYSTSRAIPLSLVRLQPTDFSLNPHAESTASYTSLLSIALDTLTAQLLSTSAQPETLRIVSAKPARSLSVWEKSLLASKGKLRMDEADPAMVSLYPVSASLAALVNHMMSLELLPLEESYREGLARSARMIQTLTSELEHVCESLEMDFSSVQLIAAWIADALAQLPNTLATEAQHQLAPLRSSLTLTSGKVMTEIWSACLPFQPTTPAIADAYRKLLDRGVTSFGEVWEKAIVDLFLDVTVTLGVPQADSDETHGTGAADLVDRILLRIPSSVTPSDDAPVDHTIQSNAASLVVAELAAVSSVFSQNDQRACAAVLVQVAHRSGVVPLSSIVPVHQLISWPEASSLSTRARSSVEFKSLLVWAEHLALGVHQPDVETLVNKSSPSDIVKPALLRAVVTLRGTDTSHLGNLIVLAESLHRAASLQALTAASDNTSRVVSLAAALLASITLVVNTSSAADTTSSEPILEQVANPESPFSPELRESISLYLAPALPGLAVDGPGTDAVGLGFVAFARFFWHLYVPNLPLDPAISLRAQANLDRRQLDGFAQLYAVVEQAEKGLTGNGHNLRMSRVGSEVEALQRKLDTAGVVPVTREGNPAMLSGLFRELRSFREQIISDAQLDQLIVDLRKPFSPELASREANLQHSIETLLNRLAIAYGDLEDILGPIRLALCNLKIGFALLLHVCRSAATLGTTSNYFSTLLQHLASFPTVAHTEAIEAVDLPLSIKVGDAPLRPSQATLLQITALSTRLSNHSVFDRDVLQRLTMLYDRLHYLWSADRRHEEEAAIEAASLYRSRADVQQIASDEEQEAAEFALLFPTFDEVMDTDAPATTAAPTNATPSHPKLLQASDQAVLTKLHIGIFGSQRTPFAKSSVSDFDKIRSTSIATLLPGLFDSSDESLDRDSAVYRIRSLVELSQAAAPSSVIDAPERDFYNEPDVYETAKAVPILLALSARLADLIVTWPDQMVLQNLKERTDTILRLSAKSSIAQVLTAIELLLNHTEDWESYASREHSIIIGRTAITNLIVEWRRLELTCWSRLLSTVAAHFDDPVSEWWFRFYETTIRGAPGVDSDVDDVPTQTPEEYYRDLVKLLDEFLSTSSIGQYRARLELVLSFANLAAKLGEKSSEIEPMPGAESLRTVSQLMLNIHGFYSQFTPRISTFLTTERARIERDVQNLIKLASWKDVNVYALKQSAIRSHHNLYKSVRKLRAVLQKPASDFFTVPEAEKTATPIATTSLFTPLDLTTALPSIPVELINSQSPHIVRLDLTLSRLSSLIATSIDPFVSLDRATAIDELAVLVITTSKALKAESKPGEEEGREQRFKSLATRKRRAWIELLRELKRLGLSHNPSPQVVANLADPGFVYGLASSHPVLGLDASLLDEPLRNQLLRSDDYHFRLLSDLSALRECPAAHSEDISTREVQRAIGSIESAISLSFENRTRLLGAVDSYVRLLATSNRIDLVAEAGSAQPTQRSTPLVETLLERVSQVLVALTEARTELANHRTALGPSNEVTSVEAAVNNAHALLADDSRRLIDIVTNRAGNVALSTPAETATLVLAREHLTSIIGQLSTSPGPTSLQYLLRPLREWSTSLVIPQVHSDDETTPSPSELATFETEHTTLVDSILVIAQELKKVSALEPAVIPDEDLPDLAIKTAGRSLQATLAIFRLPEMLEQITAFTSTAHRLSTSSHSSAVVAALLQRVAPFLRLFSNLINRHLSSFLEWHKATLKFAFVLTTVVKELSAEGFCKPAEDDGKEGEASGKTMDGTGMADGTGATNVSKDIEDESQVEGLQGEVDKEEKQDEKEGDDDAVEMSADFEGEMEDRGDGDKEDDEDGDSDTESQPDPEDQIADVDPLDPSSVDEKFWGDEATKDASTGEEVNQETTKSAGESEMAAKDDEAPKPQPKDDPTEASADEKKDNKDELPTGDDGAEMDGDGDEEADGSQEGEGEDEETEGDAVPQDENGERLDERMPEADNLDLPDDMQLDGDEKDEKDGLDLDSDMDDMGDMEEGENDNKPDELDEMGDSKDQDVDADDAVPAPDPNDAQPPAQEEDAPALDQSLGGTDQGDTGGEGAQDNAASSKPETSTADASEQSGAQAEAEVDPTPDSAMEDPENGLPEDRDDNDDASADPSPSAPSKSADGQSKQRSSTSDPKSDPSRSRPEQPSPSEPQRSLGDALQSWRRRLEAISDLQESEATNPDIDATAAGQEDEVEFVQDGDEQEQDGQALGPATEDQVQGLESLRLGEEDETQNDFEPDEMDVDDTTPTLPPPTSTIKLEGSSLAESDVKAIPAAELQEERTAVELDQDDDDLMRDDDEEIPSSTFADVGDDTPDDAEVEQALIDWRSGDDATLTAGDVWRKYEALTRDLSYALTEQLRLILEPTLATRLKGDYRSGKRLNMRKIIPYIASEFTKDLIWLRRTRPSQREYQILIAIDDSSSMADSRSVHLAFQTLTLVTRALARLEVGGISICKFGESTTILHSFDDGPVSDEAGVALLGKFSFNQRSTDVRLLVERSLQHLARAKENARSSDSDLWQLQVIISDGLVTDQAELRSLLRRAVEAKVFFVFIIIDTLHRRGTDGTDLPPTSATDVNPNSILSMKTVSYTKGANGQLELKLERFLDTFPFDSFVILRDVEALPDTLSSTLRQFFSTVNEQ